MDFWNDIYNVFAGFTERFYTDFFFWVLNASISASFLVIAIILLRLILKKAPKAIIVALWGMVAIRLICPFSLESALSLIPSEETIPTEHFQYQETRGDNYELQLVSNPIYPEEIEYVMPGNVESNSIDSMYAYYGWLGGMGVMLIYSVASYIIIKRKVRVSAPYKDNILLCDYIRTPFILGVFKPKIYLPSNIPDEEKEYVIAHEKAHLKRRDHWWKPLGFMLLTVHWFNPLMWVAYILLCRDIEFACDEKVIRSLGEEGKKPYSEALLNCSAPRKMIAACPVAFGETCVKDRIKSVLNYKKPAFWVILTAVILSIVVAVCFLTNPEKEEGEYYDLGYRLKVTVETYEATTQLPSYTETYSFKVNEGSKGEFADGIKFRITQTNLQTGTVTLKLSGTPLYDTSDTSPVRISEISVEELTDGISLATRNYERFVTFEFVKTQSIDDAVSLAITQKHKSLHPRNMGTFFGESHEILYLDSDENPNNETVKAYIYAGFGEYIKLDDTVLKTNGKNFYAVLTFVFSDGIYNLTEYTNGLGNDETPEGLMTDQSDRAELSDQIDKGLLKKVQMHYGVEALAHTATTDSRITLKATEIVTDSENPYMEIEWYNGSGEIVEPDFVCVIYYAKTTPKSIDWVEYDSFDNSEMWNFKRPEIKPYESSKIRYDLSRCPFTSDGPYRIFTQFYDASNDYLGQAIIDFTVGDNYTMPVQTTEATQPVSENKSTSSENTDMTSQDALIKDFSSAVSWVNYAPEGDAAVMENAEKPFYSEHGMADYHSVAMFETKEGFDRFYLNTSETFSYREPWDEVPSFESTSKRYDSEFFETHDLLLVYISDETASSRYKNIRLWQADGIYIDIERHCPPVYDTLMGGWFVTVEVPKGTIEENETAVARVIRSAPEVSTAPENTY